MEIIVKPEEIKILAEEGGKFIFKPQAEEQLVRLLKLKELVDNALEEVKNKITEAGMSVNPNFRGVIGNEVKCIYRAYGGKYRYNYGERSKLEAFLKHKDTYTVDTDKVEQYLKEVGELPSGITESDRENKLSIVFKEDELAVMSLPSE